MPTPTVTYTQQSTDPALPVVSNGSGKLPVGVGAYIDTDGTTPVPVTAAAPYPVTTISGFATAANQATEIAALASILAKLSADPATQTTLAAILAALASVPVTGTFWQATQPVSAASLPLPSGAATAAKQDAGNTSLSSIDGKVPALGQALAAASVPVVLTAAQLSTLAPPAAITGYATESTLSTLNGKVTACNTGAVTISAALPAGTNAIGKLAANSGVTIGAVEIASAQTLATVTTLTQMNGQAIAMGTGVRSAGTQRVTIATDDVVPAGQSGVWTVQPGNTANTTPWLVSTQATTTGGYSAYSFLSTAAVQAASIKGGAGQVYKVSFFNNSGTIAYVRLYNQTTSPGTGDAANILWRGLIPANTSGAGWVESFPDGLAFSAGIGIRVTAGVADNDATALSANVVMGNVAYK